MNTCTFTGLTAPFRGYITMATTVSVQEAKVQLIELIHLAEQGEEIVIAQDTNSK